MTIDRLKANSPKDNMKKCQSEEGPEKNEGKIVAMGKGIEEYKILKDDGSGCMKSFLDKFEDLLGPRAEEIIAEDRDAIWEQCQKLTEAENQLKEAEDLAAEREKEELQIKRKSFGKKPSKHRPGSMLLNQNRAPILKMKLKSKGERFF